MNKYLIKIAEKEKKEKNPTGEQRFLAGLGGSVGASLASVIPSIGIMHHFKNTASNAATTDADLKSYIKAKNLRHVEQKQAPRPEASHYSPPWMSRMNRTGTKPHAQFYNSDTGLHEMGHAHSFNQNRKKFYGPARQHLQMASRMGLMQGWGSLASAAMGVSNNEKVRDAAPYVGAAVAAPTLIEEGRASLSPYMHLRKTRNAATANKFLRKMAPGFGSYAIAAGASAGTGYLAKKIYEYQKAKANKK